MKLRIEYLLLEKKDHKHSADSAAMTQQYKRLREFRVQSSPRYQVLSGIAELGDSKETAPILPQKGLLPMILVSQGI